MLAASARSTMSHSVPSMSSMMMSGVPLSFRAISSGSAGVTGSQSCRSTFRGVVGRLGSREYAFQPVLYGGVGDAIPERCHALHAFVPRQVESDGKRIGKCVDEKRIHQQRRTQLIRRTGEAAQNQHTVSVGSARDEFLGDEVHPVLKR